MDIIFVVGNTGSGKSTNILRFLGYKLKQTKTKKGLLTLKTTTPLPREHRQLEAKPGSKSVTRYIFAAEIPDDMYPEEVKTRDKGLLICDSPGFGDTGGIEIDIANNVGMIRALHKTKSVRIAVLMAKDSLTANRYQGVISIAKIITKLF